jgi:hypothetical protein
LKTETNTDKSELERRSVNVRRPRCDRSGENTRAEEYLHARYTKEAVFIDPRCEERPNRKRKGLTAVGRPPENRRGEARSTEHRAKTPQSTKMPSGTGSRAGATAAQGTTAWRIHAAFPQTADGPAQLRSAEEPGGTGGRLASRAR